MLEIEVKYYLGREAVARNLVRRWGLSWKPGVFEINRIFDFPDRRLGGQGALVRVRTREDSASLTFKTKTDVDVPGAKVRREFDSRVSDPDAVLQLLAALGLLEVLRYERYRASYPAGGTAIEIDCLPGGWFCEIEGTPGAIAEKVCEAGLKGAGAIPWSYPGIFRRLCARANLSSDVWDFELARRVNFIIPPPDDPWWSTAT